MQPFGQWNPHAWQENACFPSVFSFKATRWFNHHFTVDGFSGVNCVLIETTCLFSRMWRFLAAQVFNHQLSLSNLRLYKFFLAGSGWMYWWEISDTDMIHWSFERIKMCWYWQIHLSWSPSSLPRPAHCASHSSMTWPREMPSEFSWNSRGWWK